MKKIYLALIVIIPFVILFYTFKKPVDVNNGVNTVPTIKTSNSSFIQCLVNAGVTIYGSSTCPACQNLLSYYNDFGSLDSLYFDCSSSNTQIREKCSDNMQTNYVPEIQIQGVVFEGKGTPEILAEKTGCSL